MDKILTIIAYSYNHKDYIEQLVDAVRPYKDIQLIIVDDLSSDGSVEFMDLLLEDPKQTFMSMMNLGHLGYVPSMLNNQFVHGQYHWYICVEDQIIPGALEHIRQLLIGDKPDVLINEKYGNEARAKISSRNNLSNNVLTVREKWFNN